LFVDRGPPSWIGLVIRWVSVGDDDVGVVQAPVEHPDGGCVLEEERAHDSNGQC